MEMLDEIVMEFLVESHDSLDQLDRDLMALEKTPDDRDRIASVFRNIHTIKGTSGFLAFPKLERLAHVGENLLVPLRDGDLRLTEEIADSLLAMVDGIREILGSLEHKGSEGDDDYEGLIQQLELLRSGDVVESSSPEIEIKAEEVVEELTSTESPQDDGNVTEESSSKESQGNDSAPTTDSPPTSPPASKPERAAASQGSVTDSSVRIDVNLLDRLMNLVGELVLARNQIMQLNQSSSEGDIQSAVQRVNLITTELQEGVMKTRMQPIRNAWQKLPRVVRDLSQSTGKSVQVKMEGADTELDKTILEAIKDPLTHIVRNSVDHGIEFPDARVAAGKPPEGTMTLRAWHEGGQVNIEISDDGAGINVERIREKAVASGLVSPEQANGMSDREAVQLILMPGFSTAAEVTNVSGRGVGMDVVKSNVEKIGGTLDIQTQPGQGTTLRIKIPLTLAIVPALIVSAAGDEYCIPQVSLVELVRLDGERARSEIETLHSVPVYRLRGQLLPLVSLSDQLGLHTNSESDEDSDSVNIVVLQAEDRQFGLIVDEIRDTQEIVVKPLGQHLKDLAIYAGATIMGDGTVSLILDVIGLAHRSNIISSNAAQQFIEAGDADDSEQSDRDSFLIVEPDPTARVAIPLTMVSRLEEINVSDIELSGHQQVVQYRNRIMPLITLNGAQASSSGSDTLSLVVHHQDGKDVGVLIGTIIDIVELADAVEESDSTRIIGDRITEIVDLGQITAAVR